MRLCKKCKVEKEESEFYFNKARGLEGSCKDCRKKIRKPCVGEVRKLQNQRHWTKYGLKINGNRYGYSITQELYSRMFIEQEGLCKICKKPPYPTGRGARARLSVDHDHVTGKIRGLLCAGCNSALGYAKDSPEILRAMAMYLENPAVV